MGQTWNGGTDFKRGGRAPLLPPLATALIWSLLLLAATGWSFAHMPLGLSDRNKMVLWPGCGGHAGFSLHTKNVRSVRFVGNKRGCCCNHSVGVALNVWFTMNGTCAKKNTTYMWREQAIIEWSWHVISIVACCHSVKLCGYAARAFRLQHYQVKKMAFSTAVVHQES